MLHFGLSNFNVTVECARLPENPGGAGGYRIPQPIHAGEAPDGSQGLSNAGAGLCVMPPSRWLRRPTPRPAHEYRWVTYNDMPRQMLRATIGDHEAVDRIGKHSRQRGE